MPRWVSFGRGRVQGCAMWVPTRLLCEGAHRHHLHQNPYVPVQSGSQSLKNAGGRGVRPRGAWLGNQISILQYLRFEMHHPQILRFIVEKFLFTVLFSEFLKTIWKFLSAKFLTKELLSLLCAFVIVQSAPHIACLLTHLKQISLLMSNAMWVSLCDLQHLSFVCAAALSAVFAPRQVGRLFSSLGKSGEHFKHNDFLVNFVGLQFFTSSSCSKNQLFNFKLKKNLVFNKFIF